MEHKTITLTRIVIEQLNEAGLEAYLFHSSADTGSCYIRFKDKDLCSVRVADHEGRGKYKYKFNVRTDIDNSHTTTDGAERFFFVPEDLPELVQSVLARKKYLASIGGGYYARTGQDRNQEDRVRKFK